MKMVIDACVGLAMLLPEQNSDAALALQEDFRNQVHELIAPDSLPIEIAHALTRAERQGKISQGRGQLLFDDFLNPCPKLFPYFEYLDRAMQLSSQLCIGVFDCTYAALAEEQDCKVVTIDRRFLELFPSITVSLDGV